MSSAQEIFDDGDWWRRDGAFRLLHDINPLRLSLAREAGGGKLQKKALLDIGCGGGIFAEAAALERACVVGCDSSSGAIQTAITHAQQAGVTIDYRCQNAEGLQEINAFDLVTCFEMLEHTDHPERVVATVAAALKPGGTAIFSTISRTAKAWALMIVGLENILRILPHGTHNYAHFLLPKELASYCADCGLSVNRVVGMRYSFFGHTYLLDDADLSVNYFMLAQRPA